MASHSRITIFDHLLRPLTELHGIPTTPRSWILNSNPDAGRCEFSISLSDAKATEANLQYGNLVHIKHLPSKDANGTVLGTLPDWIGWIQPPRNWDLGVVHVVAYAAESILSACPMPWVTVKGTPRDVFLKIIEHANRFQHDNGGGIVIQPGVIENTDKTFSYDLRLSAFEHIKTMVGNAAMYWDVTGTIGPDGRLQLYANLYASKGVETGFDLNNLNTEASAGKSLLTEQGFPSNIVLGHSQANTAQSRYAAEGTHAQAIADYGPLGLNVIFMGLRDAAAVRSAAQTRADNRGRPVRMTNRTALDIGQTFSSLDLGNIVNIVDRRVGFHENGGFGFDAQAQVISIKYNDLTNKADLNLEVI